ncbi:MAG: PHB depolymerase family esterase [Gammaproteobacteria bacterium]|jgi:poly(hydroxyalkanoate) depolymerase family esterase
MKIHRSIAALATRVRSLFSSRGFRTLAAIRFRGGIQAALAAWRERRRKPLPDDETHTFTARAYPGSRTRRYLVHVPNGKLNSRPRPLVLVLHGCRQDNRDIEQISGFNQLADRRGFLVAYPFVTSYRGLRNKNCWGWWFDREIHAGAGEVEDLWQIVEEIRRDYPVDARRIHVTGLSSGAGMAVAMMVAHADKIASGAAVAGMPYAERAEAVRHAFNDEPRYRPIVAVVSAMQAEMGNRARRVPIQIVHSKNDDKVEVRAAELLRDSWGHCFDIDTREAFKVNTGVTRGTAWEHSRYRDGGRKSVIETLFLEGPGHGWYGGNPGNFSFPEAPDIKRDIWRFFVSHPLPR